LKENFLVCH